VTEASALVLGTSLGVPRYLLDGRPLQGGDVVSLCCSGGWVTGRFEWDAGSETRPTFHFSIELGGGRVSMQAIELPDGALLRRP
jgi:hypothetical protein